MTKLDVGVIRNAVTAKDIPEFCRRTDEVGCKWEKITYVSKNKEIVLYVSQLIKVGRKVCRGKLSTMTLSLDQYDKLSEYEVNYILKQMEKHVTTDNNKVLCLTVVGGGSRYLVTVGTNGIKEYGYKSVQA